MKKILILSVILGLGVLTFFLLRSDESQPEVVVEKAMPDSLKSDPSKTQEKPEKQVSKKEKEEKEDEDIRGVESSKKLTTIKDMEDIDQTYIRVEREWAEVMEHLFIREFNLTDEDFQDYKAMKEGFGEDKIEAFEEFHEEMQEKHGDAYSFKPTEEMEVFEKKILKEYQDLLRKKLGDEYFKTYLKALDDFNDKLARGAKEGEPFLRMEF